MNGADVEPSVAHLERSLTLDTGATHVEASVENVVACHEEQSTENFCLTVLDKQISVPPDGSGFALSQLGQN